jgi:hypothetical protein
MHSTVFNKISILKQEIELLEVCREDTDNIECKIVIRDDDTNNRSYFMDDIEYEIVMKWLKSRVKNLEKD